MAVGSPVGSGFVLTNTTKIREALDGNPDIEGIFPRWITLGQVYNPEDLDADFTGSFIIYGVSPLSYNLQDQRLERDIGVANGFPEVLLSRDEAIVSQEILDMLDVRVGQALTVKYDLLTMIPPAFAPLEQVIFEYQPQPGGMSKG